MGPLVSRAEDWPIRLNAAIEAALDRPFKWGEHDCALFAFNIVRDLTGVDHAADYRGQYRTAAGATKQLLKRGQGTLRASVTAALGSEINERLAKRGDLVLWVQPALGETIGVCIDSRAAFAGPEGLVFVPVRDCEAAWRV